MSTSSLTRRYFRPRWPGTDDHSCDHPSAFRRRQAACSWPKASVNPSANSRKRPRKAKTRKTKRSPRPRSPVTTELTDRVTNSTIASRLNSLCQAHPDRMRFFVPGIFPKVGADALIGLQDSRCVHVIRPASDLFLGDRGIWPECYCQYSVRANRHSTQESSIILHRVYLCPARRMVFYHYLLPATKA